MRYKSVIWDHYNSFADEKYHIDRLKRESKKYLGNYRNVEDEEKFHIMLNTFAWLQEYNSRPYFQSRVENITKPTNEEILEAINYVEVHGQDLLKVAVRYSDTQTRNGLKKMAKDMIEGSKYYKELVEKNFFADK